jgi:Arc/MetJ-type ribon-helix-helix transcriptional regulator
MRTTQTMTISLPPAIMEELEIYRQKNNFTRSELVRHALRELFYSQFPRYTPTKAEIKRIEAGRREIQKGNYITLEELHAELERKNRQKSKKNIRPSAR